MDIYKRWYITQMFVDAQSAAMVSKMPITFKRMIASSDIVSDKDFSGLTNDILSTVRTNQSTKMSDTTINDDVITTTAVFTNNGVVTPYVMNTLLIVAEYNGSEFLAAITNGNSPYAMPAESNQEQVEYTIKAQLGVSNSGVINLNMDPAAIATNERVDKVRTELVTITDRHTKRLDVLEQQDKSNVKTQGDQEVGGVKTFLQTIVGSISGVAGAAKKLVTARKINGAPFDGTADINVKASNDADILHKSGDETADGVKRFIRPLDASMLLQNIPVEITTVQALVSKFITDIGGSIWATRRYVGYDRKLTDTPFPNDLYPVVDIITRINRTYVCVYSQTGQMATTTVANNIVGEWNIMANDKNVAHTSGDETISGNKRFVGNIEHTATQNFLGIANFKSGVELYGKTPYIDFHNQNSTDDFTTRIIENAAGTVDVVGQGNTPAKIRANLLGNVEGALVTRTINFTDFNTVANNMTVHKGNWAGRLDTIANSPFSTSKWGCVVVIPYDTSNNAGIILLAETIRSSPTSYVGHVNQGGITWEKLNGNADTAKKADIATRATTADSATKATRADTAAKADLATTADSAKSADTAAKAILSDTATNAKTADVATKASTADLATKATRADNATKADNAAKADTATKAVSAYAAENLLIPRKIDGVAFNGSADISTWQKVGTGTVTSQYTETATFSVYRQGKAWYLGAWKTSIKVSETVPSIDLNIKYEGQTPPNNIDVMPMFLPALEKNFIAQRVDASKISLITTELKVSGDFTSVLLCGSLLLMED